MTATLALLLSLNCILAFVVAVLVVGQRLKYLSDLQKKNEELADNKMQRMFELSLREDLSRAQNAQERVEILIRNYKAMRNWVAWKHGEESEKARYYDEYVANFEKLLEKITSEK